MGFPYIDLNHHMDYQNPWACINLSSIVGGEHVPLADKEFFFSSVTRHAKRLFLSGNQALDSEMSGQFIGTNLLNKGL